MSRAAVNGARLTATLAVLAALVLAGGSAAWAATAHFVAAASSATWDGTVVTVTFQEAGLQPGATTTISVEAAASIDTQCRQDGTVIVSTHSSATVTDVSDYLVDADGTVTGVRELTLVVRPPIIEGLPCTTVVTSILTVTLRDLDTGAVLVLPGQLESTSTPV